MAYRTVSMAAIMVVGAYSGTRTGQREAVKIRKKRRTQTKITRKSRARRNILQDMAGGMGRGCNETTAMESHY